MVTVQDAGGPAPGDLASIGQRGDAAATSAVRIVLWIFILSALICTVGAEVALYYSGYVRGLINA